MKRLPGVVDPSHLGKRLAQPVEGLGVRRVDLEDLEVGLDCVGPAAAHGQRDGTLDELFSPRLGGVLVGGSHVDQSYKSWRILAHGIAVRKGV